MRKYLPRKTTRAGRAIARSEYERNPNIRGAYLHRLVEKKLEITIAQATVYGWLRRLKKVSPPPVPTEAAKEGEISLDRILKAVDVDTLANLVYRGFMQKLKAWQDAHGKLKEHCERLKDMLAEAAKEKNRAIEERRKIQEAYNNLLAKKKVGVCTLDSGAKRIIGKTVG